MRSGKLLALYLLGKNDRDSYPDQNAKSFARCAEDIAIAYLVTFAFGVALIVAANR